MNYYRHPTPGVCILCEREAYYSSENPDLRLTFDTNIRYRYGFPDESELFSGTPLIQEGERILEIKTNGAMPIWLSRVLSECEIYPISFSKYAHAYLDITSKNKISEMKGTPSYV